MCSQYCKIWSITSWAEIKSISEISLEPHVYVEYKKSGSKNATAYFVVTV
jgi:hypothetical protein